MNMKLSSIFALSLLYKTKGQLPCPSSLTETVAITPTLTMYYAIASDSSEAFLCVQLESASESWVGLGLSPDGAMIGSEAIIGLPDEGTVKKYMLEGKSLADVVEMSEEEQKTLIDARIVQANGMTIMSYAKALTMEDVASGSNTLIYAVGSDNTLGYHASRGSFTLDLAGEGSTSSTAAAGEETSTSSSMASIATLPTTLVATTTVASFDENSTSSSMASFEAVSTAVPTPTTTEEDLLNIPPIDEASVTMVPSGTSPLIQSPTYSPTAAEVDQVASIPTYSPTAGEIDGGAPTYPPTPPEAIATDALDDDLNITETDVNVVDSNATGTSEVATPSPTIVGAETDVSPSPTSAANETVAEPTTPSPTVVTNETASTSPTASSTVQSTSNATAVSTQSSTSNSTAESTSNSTSNATESPAEPEEEKFDPDDFKPPVAESASKENESSGSILSYRLCFTCGVALLAFFGL